MDGLSSQDTSSLRRFGTLPGRSRPFVQLKALWHPICRPIDRAEREELKKSKSMRKAKCSIQFKMDSKDLDGLWGPNVWPSEFSSLCFYDRTTRIITDIPCKDPPKDGLSRPRKVSPASRHTKKSATWKRTWLVALSLFALNMVCSRL